MNNKGIVPVVDDLQRLQQEYKNREQRLGSGFYSPFKEVNLFTLQMRQRATLTLLRKYGFCPLSQFRILEVGCYDGSKLFEYLLYGAHMDQLHGCDLMHASLLKAYEILPSLAWLCADGQNLPYPTSSFDLVLQNLVFTSILDDTVRINIAQEMIRDLQPNGMILFYDFWLNPTNPQTRGIRLAEVQNLFPGRILEFHKITLAPPLARHIVPLSWGLALLMENLKIFNSHFLVAISQEKIS